MTEYERTRTLPALPELVFDQVGNPRLADRWLPHELHVRPEDPPAVTVREEREDGAREVPALFNTQPDQFRVEWETRQESHYAGWLQVAGIGGGASEVTVHLSFFDEEHAPPEASVSASLDESLDRLAEQVRMRTENAG